MVYISSNNIFPKVQNGEPTKVKFKNQVTKDEFEIEVEDLSLSNNYYSFTFDSSALANFTTGQYSYSILNETDEKLAIGIAQYGNYIPTNTTYNSSINIIAYGSD